LIRIRLEMTHFFIVRLGPYKGNDRVGLELGQIRDRFLNGTAGSGFRARSLRVRPLNPTPHKSDLTLFNDKDHTQSLKNKLF
jgi:hypothetical protein